MPPLTGSSINQFLLVSADSQRRAHWQQLLARQWSELACYQAHDGASALYQLATRSLGLALIDRELPDMPSHAMRERALQLQPTLHVLMLPLASLDSEQPQQLWQCLQDYAATTAALTPLR
ncbi:MAG TPA: hypothetical protein VFV64_09890 [Permianibacter sp.]|nr:hypothetical protein [Permianibacter sp.]